MPKTTSGGRPKESELPSTLQRSSKKAQRTFAKAHDSAADEYGEGRRAHQTAYAALKHTFEKVGDHWERKSKKGQSANGDAGSKRHLYAVAKRLDISGRSKMGTRELANAIKKTNRQSSKKAS
ncbi:MAG: ChaB family protein [Acidimicrobiales bacterium]